MTEPDVVTWAGWHGRSWEVTARCGCCGAEVVALVPDGDEVYCTECGAEAPIIEDKDGVRLGDWHREHGWNEEDA